MATDFNGRAALITGSGVGIGREVARLLASRGAFVGIHYRLSKAEAEETLRDVEAAGGTGVLVSGDIADENDANAIVDTFVDAAGRLDVLVNNAGTPVDRASIEDCSTELWQQVIGTNLTGTFFVTRRAIPHLKASGNGAIVNNLSLSVQTGGANGAGAYAVAKGGIQVMTRTLARELAPAVRSNAVMPGVIETRHHEEFSTPERMAEYRKQTPLGRNGTAEEVAATIAFLASDDASFLNGALIDINGGRFLR
jgi:3-oxoacyl-[acyl-carrier protein] reductase